MDDFRPLLHERPWLLNTAIVKIGHRESADFEVGLNFEGKKDYAIHHSWGGGSKTVQITNILTPPAIFTSYEARKKRLRRDNVVALPNSGYK
jgi:hypothetical protein